MYFPVRLVRNRKPDRKARRSKGIYVEGLAKWLEATQSLRFLTQRSAAGELQSGQFKEIGSIDVLLRK